LTPHGVNSLPTDLPPTLATSPAFYKTLLTVFRQVVPLSRFLNTPLLKKPAGQHAAKSLP
jgi:hypothetical protein